MSNAPEYKLERIFNAPRDLVWKAWTDPDLLHRWYGPGADTVIHEFDLTPGRLWLNEMKYGENSMFQKVIFKEITPPEKMIWHHHTSTDAQWNDTTSPMMPNWPPLLLTTVIFEEIDDQSSSPQTKVILSQIPLDATDEQSAAFGEMMSNMDGGWGAGYKIIDDILDEIK